MSVGKIFLAVALFCSALAFTCGGCCKTCPPAVTVVPAPGPGCLEMPPPIGVYVQFDGPPACPAEFEACLTAPAALALERNVRALQRYSRDAWTRCSPQSPPKPGP